MDGLVQVWDRSRSPRFQTLVSIRIPYGYINVNLFWDSIGMCSTIVAIPAIFCPQPTCWSIYVSTDTCRFCRNRYISGSMPVRPSLSDCLLVARLVAFCLQIMTDTNSKNNHESLPLLPSNASPLRFPLYLVSPSVRPYLELIRIEKVSLCRRHSKGFNG